MNRGLVLKSCYENWPVTLLCGVALLGVEAILAYVLPSFQEQFSQAILQIRYIQTLVGALLGIRSAGQLGPEMFTAFPWVHPVVLALIWTHAVVCCTRMPAGEIDRGTIDMTLTLPVMRWEVLRSETVVWIAAGLSVVLSCLAGNLIGAELVEPPAHAPFDRTLIVLANLMCMYLAVGGLASLVSALSSRRGPAITIVFLLLLASFLLNFLAQFWQIAERFSFLGILDYYRPLPILRDGNVPWRDMTILVGVGTSLWIAAGVAFNRRDVCTV